MTLKLKNRIAVLACLPVLVIIVLGSVMLYSNQQRLTDRMIHRDLNLLQNAVDLGAHLTQSKRHEKNYIIFKNKSYFNALKTEVELTEKRLRDFSELAESYPRLLSAKQFIEQAMKRYKEIIAGLPDMTEVEYGKVNSELKGLTDAVFDRLEQIQTNLLPIMEEGLNTQQYHIRNLVILISASILYFALICLAWTLLVWRSVMSRIARLKLASHHLAKGDFRPSLEPGPIDEIGQLVLDFNEMSQNIADREDKIKNLNAELIKLTNQLKQQ